ncbi:SulP family inorganic anion transporter [Streptomyces mirabilis]|uniref:SulP family inorganic anion transporter n=1 Tax=Streptomyces mirabilis TaxID=68239 RepID=UPI0033C1D29E
MAAKRGPRPRVQAACSSSPSPRDSERRRPTPRAATTRVDANRELIGLGAAGLGAGLSSGMVVNGSLSKTAVNWSAGARTELSGVFVVGPTVITLLFLTGLSPTRCSRPW